MALTQSHIIKMHILVAGIELKRFFEVRKGGFRLTKTEKREAKLEYCARVIAVQRDRRFEFDLCHDQPILNSTQLPQRSVPYRVVPIAFEGFEEQLFGACQVLFTRLAQPSGEIFKQDHRDADPGIDRLRVDLQRL